MEDRLEMTHGVAGPAPSPSRPEGDDAAPRDRRSRERIWPRIAFYSHLWVGILFTVALLVISITGILLNHKRALELMPDVPHTPSGDFAMALPLATLVDRALEAVNNADAGPSAIDRMDVRPRDGFVKVRMRDATSTEVTVDLIDGRVLHVGPRGDVFFEKLHSGEIFGGDWILLSDAAAVALTLLLLTGVWLWLRPRWRR
jgi:hypothetical protein